MLSWLTRILCKTPARSRQTASARPRFRPRLENLEERLTPAISVNDLTTLTAQNLVQNLVGQGVSVSNVQYTGANVAAGIFQGGAADIGFDSGVVLSTGRAKDVVGPNNVANVSTSNGTPGDPDLDQIVAPDTTNDAAVLEFDFVPKTSSLTFNYVFSSDEYLEFVGGFNDVFGFFVNGQNVALIPGTNTAVSINDVNDVTNSQFFVDNSNPPFPRNTSMDGLTVVLSAVANVNAGQTNHIKLAIADTFDDIVDSNVFIQAGSFSSPQINTFNPIRYVTNPATGTYDGYLTLTNSGTAPFAGPIFVSFPNLPQGVTMANAAGVDANGTPFYTINSGLVSGQTVRQFLQISDPGNVPLPTFYPGVNVTFSNAPPVLAATSLAAFAAAPVPKAAAAPAATVSAAHSRGLDLNLPEFSKQRNVAGSIGLSRFATGVVSIDVDKDGDGQFNSPGETDYTQVNVSGGIGAFNLTALSNGTHLVRARFTDPAGDVRSVEASVLVDPDAGVLGSRELIQLANMIAAGHVPTKAERDASLLLYDAQGRVLVNARATLNNHLDEFRQALQALGMDVLQVTPDQNLVSGYLPLNQIHNLTSVPFFSAATAGYRPITRAGSVQTEGDTVMLADTFRATTGFNGAGTKVGVISDSVNQFAGGLADSQATGDLPPGVQVLADGPAGSTDEGRAMLEIVHDVAPGAALAFSAATTPGTFATSINNLVSAGSDVVVDDIGFADSPFFNDGVIAKAAAKAAASGTVYVSAAGNDGNAAWSDSWRPSAGTVAGINGTWQDLDPTAGVNLKQAITVPLNQELVLSFQWDNAFLEGGSPLPNFQVPTDMDIVVSDAAGTVLFNGNTNNLATDEAVEVVDYVNTSGTTNLFLSFRLVAGPAPTTLKWIATGSPVDPMAAGEGNTPAEFGQVVVPSTIAAAAADVFTPTVPEPYSSLGGNVAILFDAAGNRLAAPDIRTKPEVTGPDGVNTSFFGVDDPTDPDTFPNFFGTSAAAPHVAAAASLLLSQTANRATPAQISAHLKATALDINTPGVDNLTGAGLVQLQELILPAVPLAAPAYGPARFVFTGQTYDGYITILNPGATDITGTVIVAFPQLPAGVTLANANTTIAGGTRAIAVPNVTLKPQQTLRVLVKFSDPNAENLGSFYAGLPIQLLLG